MRSLAVLPSAMLARIHSVCQKKQKFQFLHEPTSKKKKKERTKICLYSPVLWPLHYDQPRGSELLPAWSASHENSWFDRYAADTLHHERTFKNVQRIQNIRDLKTPQKGHWWFSHISINVVIKEGVWVCICVSLGVSTADFVENQESSSTRLCQGLTGGGITVLYPNTEQSLPSPSDQPEMPGSTHKQFKSYRLQQGYVLIKGRCLTMRAQVPLTLRAGLSLWVRLHSNSITPDSRMGCAHTLLVRDQFNVQWC